MDITDVTAPLLPVPGDRVSCGNRTDLPRKLRRHAWAPMGPDVSNHGEHGIVQVEVQACLVCGKDKR
jgi:hypothetical protein